MATVFIPTMLQSMTGGVKQVQFEARNIRQVIEQLDQLYPGVKDRLVEEGPGTPQSAESSPARWSAGPTDTSGASARNPRRPRE